METHYNVHERNDRISILTQATDALVILGALVGAAIAFFAQRARIVQLQEQLIAANARNDESQLSAQAAIEALLERAKNDLRESTASRATERVGEIVAPLTKQLGDFDRYVREIESRRNEDTGNLKAQIDNLLKRSDKLETAAMVLSTQTSTLVTALKSPSTRGKWGEIQLRNVVEKAGMLAHCDFAEQQTIAIDSGRIRPDMTINLPGDRKVFVDAKAPTDALQAAFEAIDEDAKRELVRRHAKALQEHIDALAKRAYHTTEGSADFVIMFVPGEAFLSSACTENPMLIEYALDKGVLVTGPLSLISLLRSFAMGWQAVKQEENAKRIAALGRELYERAYRFADKLTNVGRHLERSVGAFNEAVGSYESRLLPQGRKLKDDAAFTAEDMPEINVIDIAPRAITAIETEQLPKRSKRTTATPTLFPNDESLSS
ncbi:MAG: DNA recombination protein RmuC [Candidatus Eremiobacteraeota bacterium]|nr:DNA recombination protein RmuC [Candidatus Eremiobacteraeota bacterium]